MSNENIDIAYILTDEVLAWKRPIRLGFKLSTQVWQSAHISLHWNEQDGYSANVEQFFDNWSEDEKAEFQDWLLDSENLSILDDLTAWKENNTSLEQD
jgi:hypothetical protein